MSIFDKMRQWDYRFQNWLRRDEIEKKQLEIKLKNLEEEQRRLRQVITEVATKSNQHFVDFHMDKDAMPFSYSYAIDPNWQYLSDYGYHKMPKFVRKEFINITVPDIR